MLSPSSSQSKTSSTSCQRCYTQRTERAKDMANEEKILLKAEFLLKMYDASSAKENKKSFLKFVNSEDLKKNSIEQKIEQNASHLGVPTLKACDENHSLKIMGAYSPCNIPKHCDLTHLHGANERRMAKKAKNNEEQYDTLDDDRQDIVLTNFYQRLQSGMQSDAQVSNECQCGCKDNIDALNLSLYANSSSNRSNIISSASAEDTIQGCCTNYLDAVCGLVLQLVHTTVSRKLDEYCHHYLDKIDNLHSRLERNEDILHAMFYEFKEKLTKQNEECLKQCNAILDLLRSSLPCHHKSTPSHSSQVQACEYCHCHSSMSSCSASINESQSTVSRPIDDEEPEYCHPLMASRHLQEENLENHPVLVLNRSLLDKESEQEYTKKKSTSNRALMDEELNYHSQSKTSHPSLYNEFEYHHQTSLNRPLIDEDLNYYHLSKTNHPSVDKESQYHHQSMLNRPLMDKEFKYHHLSKTSCSSLDKQSEYHHQSTLNSPLLDKEFNCHHVSKTNHPSVDKESQYHHHSILNRPLLDKEFNYHHVSKASHHSLDKESEYLHQSMLNRPSLDKEFNYHHLSKASHLSLDKESEYHHQSMLNRPLLDKELKYHHLSKISCSSLDKQFKRCYQSTSCRPLQNKVSEYSLNSKPSHPIKDEEYRFLKEEDSSYQSMATLSHFLQNKESQNRVTTTESKSKHSLHDKYSKYSHRIKSSRPYTSYLHQLPSRHNLQKENTKYRLFSTISNNIHQKPKKQFPSRCSSLDKVSEKYYQPKSSSPTLYSACEYCHHSMPKFPLSDKESKNYNQLKSSHPVLDEESKKLFPQSKSSCPLLDKNLNQSTTKQPKNYKFFCVGCFPITKANTKHPFEATVSERNSSYAPEKKNRFDDGDGVHTVPQSNSEIKCLSKDSPHMTYSCRGNCCCGHEEKCLIMTSSICDNSKYYKSNWPQKPECILKENHLTYCTCQPNRLEQTADNENEDEEEDEDNEVNKCHYCYLEDF